MAQSMRCLQITEWGSDLALAERPIPPVGTNDVLVEVEATGMGLTVGNVMNGDLGNNETDLPRIPGHEIVGTVVETGDSEGRNPSSSEKQSFSGSRAEPGDREERTPSGSRAPLGDGVGYPQEGDRVAAYFYLSCGHCEYCRRGRDSLCESLDGFVGVDIDGGLAEYTRLPADNVLRIPGGIDPIDATAVPDAIATPYHVAAQRANVTPGDDVMVLGAGGGVGVHLVQMVEYFGGNATAVDRVEDKLDRCRSLGAERTINTAKQSLTEALADDPTEYNAVVDFTGSMDLLTEAMSALGPQGRLVNLTTFRDRSFDLSPREQVFTEMEVVGSRYCSKYELVRSAELVHENEIEPVVTEVVELAGGQELIDQIRKEEVVGRGAVAIAADR